MVELTTDIPAILEGRDLARAAQLAPFVQVLMKRLSAGELAAYADRAIARDDVGLMAALQCILPDRRRESAAIDAVIGRLETALAVALGYITHVPDRAVAA